MITYAGIGSRETPPDILALMENIGERLAKRGWMLRSGGSPGADTAFEKGCDKGNGTKEIFLPWKGFNKNPSLLFHTPEAAIMASKVHPAWDKLTFGSKALHARNCHQILGPKLDDPVKLIICWTEGGKEVGGTATAIRIGKNHSIVVANLALNTDIKDLVLKIENDISQSNI